MIESNLYKLFRYIGIITFFLISLQSVKCQEITSDSILRPDSIRSLHSPRKATLFSILIPGLGQVYNKKYWKVPIIYATFGVLGYFIAYNNKYYKYFKGAYAYKLELESPPTFGNYNTPAWARQIIWRKWGKPKFETKYPELAYLEDQSLETGMNTYRRWRDLNGLGFIAFYAFQVIDADVDAHFFNYDISQNISMNVRPGIVINDYLAGYAIGLKINVHF